MFGDWDINQPYRKKYNNNNSKIAEIINKIKAKGEYDEEEIEVLAQVLQNASTEELKEVLLDLCIDLDENSTKSEQKQQVVEEKLDDDSAPSSAAASVTAALKQKREEALAALAAARGAGFKLPKDFDCGVLWTDPGLVISYFLKWKVLAKENMKKFVGKDPWVNENFEYDENDENEREFAELQRRENEKRANNNNNDDDSAAENIHNNNSNQTNNNVAVRTKKEKTFVQQHDSKKNPSKRLF